MPSGLNKLLRLWALVPKGPKSIGGIPVGVDNAAYISTGKADSYVTDESFFLTPPLDTGDAASKQITFYRYTAATVGGKAASARFFNDLFANNVDFYSASATSPGPRTVTIAARYVIYPVYKADAADCYVYYTVDGVKHYLVKGNNVTD